MCLGWATFLAHATDVAMSHGSLVIRQYIKAGRATESANATTETER